MGSVGEPIVTEHTRSSAEYATFLQESEGYTRKILGHQALGHRARRRRDLRGHDLPLLRSNGVARAGTA